jgi:segregation and condensation protein B
VAPEARQVAAVPAVVRRVPEWFVVYQHPLTRLPWMKGTARLPRDRRPPSAYRLPPDAAPDAGRGPLARDARLAFAEAALFAADEPLTPQRLAAAAGLADAAEARRLVERLRALYEQDGAAFQVEEVAGGWQLLTRPEFHPWLARLRRASEQRLTPAAREALTLIAYRQPITRADVEAVRGVGSGEVLRQLMEKGLVRIAGRDDSLGRPVLYATTKKFLQLYGLRGLRDLPPAEGLAPPKGRTPSAAEDEGGAKGPAMEEPSPPPPADESPS